MTIYLVRHGQTDWNVQKKIQGNTDIPLNEIGRQQASDLAKRLAAKTADRKIHVTKVYTSIQIRAAETAQTVAETLGISWEVLSGLEEMSMGEWEGLRWHEVEENYGEVYPIWNAKRRYYKTPGGESYNDVLKRTLMALQVILQNEKDNDVLVVTHSAVIMALRSYLAKKPFEEDIMLSYATKNAELVGIDAVQIGQAIERFLRGE